MAPKKKGGKAAEPDDLGLPAEGEPPLSGPQDAIRRLREKTLMDRVTALYGFRPQ
jgi:hypothetical protein